jgi:hypothetical protein
MSTADGTTGFLRRTSHESRYRGPHALLALGLSSGLGGRLRALRLGLLHLVLPAAAPCRRAACQRVDPRMWSPDGVHPTPAASPPCRLSLEILTHPRLQWEPKANSPRSPHEVISYSDPSSAQEESYRRREILRSAGGRMRGRRGEVAPRSVAPREAPCARSFPTRPLGCGHAGWTSKRPWFRPEDVPRTPADHAARATVRRPSAS